MFVYEISQMYGSNAYKINDENNYKSRNVEEPTLVGSSKLLDKPIDYHWWSPIQIYLYLQRGTWERQQWLKIKRVSSSSIESIRTKKWT